MKLYPCDHDECPKTHCTMNTPTPQPSEAAMAAARECKTPDGLTVYDSSEVAKMNGSLFVLAHKHNAALAHLSASLTGAQARLDSANKALDEIDGALPDSTEDAHRPDGTYDFLGTLVNGVAALRRENAELKK